MPIVGYSFNDSNLSIDSGVITLKDEYIKKYGYRFKKITGTRLADILGFDNYSSPFKTWLQIVQLFKDDMDPTLADVGNTIEPIIREFVTKQLKIEYCVHDPKTVNYDVFKSNKIFGGIPDGEPMTLGKIDYSTDLPMLEVKSSSIDKLKYETNADLQLRMIKNERGEPIVVKPNGKKDEWFENGKLVVSKKYQFQLALYMYLRKAKYGIFAIGFLQPIDYVNPQAFNPLEREIRLLKMSFDHQKFEKYINQATTWYENHVVKGISPKMTNEDQKWLEKQMQLLRKNSDTAQ